MITKLLPKDIPRYLESIVASRQKLKQAYKLTVEAQRAVGGTPAEEEVVYHIDAIQQHLYDIQGLLDGADWIMSVMQRDAQTLEEENNAQEQDR